MVELVPGYVEAQTRSLSVKGDLYLLGSVDIMLAIATMMGQT